MAVWTPPPQATHQLPWCARCTKSFIAPVNSQRTLCTDCLDEVLPPYFGFVLAMFHRVPSVR
jgi:hypothetical protein